MKRVRKSKRPIVPATARREENALQGTESRRRLLDVAARSDIFEAIRQGIDDIANGRTRAAREIFLTFPRKYGTGS
jgi:hypothetical protein